MNYFLIAGGFLSLFAATLHISIMIGGPAWYRFFGAGDSMVTMAETGSWYPGAITFSIAITLFIWSCYAFSGAGLISHLPFLEVGLICISVVYLARGLMLIPVYFYRPQMLNSFIIWSSLVCLVFGVTYAVGTSRMLVV